MADIWDQRIARAQRLCKNNPAAQEVLELYLKVITFQKNLSQNFKGEEHVEIQSVLRFLPQLRILVAELVSEQVQDAMAKVGDDAERWSELLLRCWEQETGVEDSAEAFLAQVLLQPYAQHVTSRMTISAENTATRCPACGNPPQLSLLREFNTGAKRSLLCSLCSAEWEFRRVLCPWCGEQHKDKLPVFTAEEFPQARIEACDSCKSYIKCIDLSKDGMAIPPVDDVATLALDVWAQEQGYARRSPNLFLLESGDPRHAGTGRA
jgi:FdhE protein